jgi:hypothetical protein
MGETLTRRRRVVMDAFNDLRFAYVVPPGGQERPKWVDARVSV